MSIQNNNIEISLLPSYALLSVFTGISSCLNISEMLIPCYFGNDPCPENDKTALKKIQFIECGFLAIAAIVSLVSICYLRPVLTCEALRTFSDKTKAFYLLACSGTFVLIATICNIVEHSLWCDSVVDQNHCSLGRNDETIVFHGVQLLLSSVVCFVYPIFGLYYYCIKDCRNNRSVPLITLPPRI